MLSVDSYIAKRNPEIKDIMYPSDIQENYKRFGGIIRYVIPKSKKFLSNVMAAQDSVLKRTKTVDAFAPFANIEKITEKISHFILCML